MATKKRKETLFRKCHELSVKSDADVSLVCIGPDGEIEAWPNHEKVRAMLTKHREKQAGKKKYSHESESEEKKSANDSAEKLPAELLTSLWREIDSKLETLEEKIKMLSFQKASDFSDSVNNSSGSFMKVYDWDDLLTNTIESYGQPLRVSSVQLNPPTQSADTDYSFITDNLWEPEIELLGAQDSTVNSLQNYYHLGSDWNLLLQW